MDLYNGEIVAWQSATRPTFDLVSGMLKKALSRLRNGEQPLLHSDSKNVGVSYFCDARAFHFRSLGGVSGVVGGF
jgi:hypothetical protein